MKRRQFLRLVGGVGALTVANITIGCELEEHPETPGSFPDLQEYGGQAIEAMVDVQTGKITVNDAIAMRNSACLGCYSSCGNRVKVDKKTGVIAGLQGNPYNPSNTFPHLDSNEPLTEAYMSFSSYKDNVNSRRGTLCARGRATLESHYDPMRITIPLKRAGKRGEGKWKPISWQELLEETVEGGKLFADIGENQNIEGFRQVRDNQTLIDPERPDLGTVSNQLVFNGGRGDGRTVFTSRFMGAFGSVNTYSHGYS